MDDKEVRLISMNKDEAVVAETVRTYKRKELEGQLIVVNEILTKNERKINETAAIINNLQAQITAAQRIILQEKEIMEANVYKRDLYKALLDAFNSKYPNDDRTENSQNTEEV